MNNNVTPDEQKKQREAIQVIANSIAALARSVASLLNGPLNRRALLVLLASSSGRSQREVDAILVALMDLEKDWLKK